MSFANLLQHPKLARIEFDIRDAHVSVVNALRRVILAEIPTIATPFDPYEAGASGCTFLKNTTSLHNEFLAHRFSLIPIHFSLAEIAAGAHADYRFVIDLHNTGNTAVPITTKDIGVFYKDAVVRDEDARERLFPKDPVTDDYILLTRLKPNVYNPKLGEALHVEFKAQKGCGRDHAGFCPASACTYAFSVDPEKADNVLAEKLRVADPSDHDRIRRQFQASEAQRHYKTNAALEPCEFRFVLESECALSPFELFGQALTMLIQKVNRLSVDEEKMQVASTNNGLYTITYVDEDHTLGNLIQAWIHERCVVPGTLFTYCGYVCPHPLERTLVFKLCLKNVDDNVKSCLDTAYTELVQHLTDIRNQWSTFSATQNLTTK